MSFRLDDVCFQLANAVSPIIEGCDFQVKVIGIECGEGESVDTSRKVQGGGRE